MTAQKKRPVVLSVENVDKRFPRVHAVKDLSLQIHEGEFVALLGPNGAGKTTLLEMIEGLQTPDLGRIVVDGFTYDKDEKKIRALMGLAFQETRFPEKIRVGEALELFSAFYGGDRHRIREVLELVALTEKKNAYVNNLSGGQRQRLALGIGIIQEPRILLLDEPTTGLDPHARREIWRILADLKKKGTTLLLTTHYMEEAEVLCERIIILFRGKVLADGKLKELIAEHANHEIVEFKLKTANARVVAGLAALKKTSHFAFDESAMTGVIHADDAAAILPEFLRKVGRHNLTSFAARPLTLDDLFIKMTGRHLDA